jgi:hypothetical protein
MVSGGNNDRDDIGPGRALLVGSPLNFLCLPPEIRAEVYSYLLPKAAPVSNTRALRATCRLMNDEVGKEVERVCDKRMSELKSMLSKNPLLPKDIDISFKTDTSFLSARLHVEVKIPLAYLSVCRALQDEWAYAAIEELHFAFRTFFQFLPTIGRTVHILFVPCAGMNPETPDAWVQVMVDAADDYIRQSWVPITFGEMASLSFVVAWASPGIPLRSVRAEAAKKLEGHEYPDFGGVGRREPGTWHCQIWDVRGAPDWVEMNRLD